MPGSRGWGCWGDPAPQLSADSYRVGGDPANWLSEAPTLSSKEFGKNRYWGIILDWEPMMGALWWASAVFMSHSWRTISQETIFLGDEKGNALPSFVSPFSEAKSNGGGQQAFEARLFCDWLSMYWERGSSKWLSFMGGAGARLIGLYGVLVLLRRLTRISYLI